MNSVRLTSLRRALLLFPLLVGIAACSPPANPPAAGQGNPALSSPLASPIEGNAPASLRGLDLAQADAPKDAPKPDPGKASISGLAYSPGLGMGVKKTGFYLTKALGNNNRQISPILIGPEESQGDIRGYTDDKGVFTMNNIEPGNYFLVLSAPNDWVPFERDNTTGAPRLIELKADQQLALGVMYVPWP